MLENGTWGDKIVLTSISMLWSIRITVVNAVNLTTERIRHNKPLVNADIVLLYNGRNQYSACSEYEQKTNSIVVGSNVHVLC